MKSVALTMIVKDEEAVLERCLKSTSDIFDEIIIVDTGSTDKTKLIAHSYNAKIYDFYWNGSFADARNFALDKSTCDWNLVLDADEYINNDCKQAIQQFINNNYAIGRIKLINQFNGDDGCISFAQGYISRLFPKGIQYQGKIHEQLDSVLPRMNVSVEVFHDGYMTNRSARNIPLLELEIKSNPFDPYFHYQIAKEYKGINDHKRALEHLNIAYNLLRGEESYRPNVVVNLMYEIIATEQLENGLDIIAKEQETLQGFSDFHFVCGVYYMKLILSNTAKYVNLFPMIEKSYLRCLEIGETNQFDSVQGTGSFTAWHNLGSLYEVMGQIDKAISCHKKAADYAYEPSIKRLKILM